MASEVRAINIRFGPGLDERARQHCDDVGISLNALVCVALDAYLRGLDAPAAPSTSPRAAKPAQQPAEPAQAPADPPAKLQTLRDEFQHRQAVSRPVLTASRLEPAPAVLEIPPKPELGPKPSKADRSRLAEWHRLYGAKEKEARNLQT